VIQALHSDAQLPPSGSVLGAGNSTVCEECPRKKSEKKLSAFRRISTFQPNFEECLLEQGILCSGIATRSGCLARCPTANMPCIGCYGPAPDVTDQGARMISAVASVVQGTTRAEIDKVLAEVLDPAGTFYRFGLAHSLLKHALFQVKE
jgi:F420-non-reducing hydrogenase small subunit